MNTWRREKRWGTLWEVRPEGIEPPTSWFEARRSVRLSYGRTWKRVQLPSLKDMPLYHGRR